MNLPSLLSFYICRPEIMHFLFILNPEKCHYMCLGKVPLSVLLKFCGAHLKASELETILGIQTDNKLNFGNHIKFLCSKASLKLGASQRISNLLHTQKKNLVQFCNKISIQLFPTCLDFLFKKIKFSIKQYSRKSS